MRRPPGTWTWSTLHWALFWALMGTLPGGCTEHHNVAKYSDDQHYLSIANVACIPDVFAGEPVEAGKVIECRFVVEGVEKTDASLICENDSGEPVDCLENTAYMHLRVDTDFPEELSPPVTPMARCAFRLDTQFVSGDTIDPIVWVATNGEHTVRKRFAPELIPNDQVDEPPEIWVDCLRQPLDNLHAGEPLTCLLFVHDPDPLDRPDFVVTLINNPGPPPGPLDIIGPMQGRGPGIFQWSWKTQEGLPLGKWVFSFTLPGTSAHYDLEVNLTAPLP